MKHFFQTTLVAVALFGSLKALAQEAASAPDPALIQEFKSETAKGRTATDPEQRKKHFERATELRREILGLHSNWTGGQFGGHSGGSQLGQGFAE